MKWFLRPDTVALLTRGLVMTPLSPLRTHTHSSAWEKSCRIWRNVNTSLRTAAITHLSKYQARVFYGAPETRTHRHQIIFVTTTIINNCASIHFKVECIWGKLTQKYWRTESVTEQISASTFEMRSRWVGAPIFGFMTKVLVGRGNSLLNWKSLECSDILSYRCDRVLFSRIMKTQLHRRLLIRV